MANKNFGNKNAVKNYEEGKKVTKMSYDIAVKKCVFIGEMLKTDRYPLGYSRKYYVDEYNRYCKIKDMYLEQINKERL